MKNLFLFLTLCIFSISINANNLVPQEETTETLYPFREKEKWGYMNAEGKTVIAAKYITAERFSDGLGRVSLDGNLIGYVDAKGTMVFKAIYYLADDFSDGVAFVCIKKGDLKKWYVMDKAGTLNATGDYKYRRLFSNGLCAVELEEGKYGYINKIGQLAFESTFGWAGNFSDGLACVSENGRQGFIDSSGELIIPYQFITVGAVHFNNGLAAIRLKEERENGLYKIGFINKSGELQNTDWLTQLDNETEYSIYSLSGTVDNRSIMMASDSWWAIVDTDGKIIRNFAKTELVYDFANGMAAFQEYNEEGNGSGKWGFFDIDGNIAIEPQFNTIDNFTKDGIAWFSKTVGSTIYDGYINKEGKVVKQWSYQY